MSKTTLTQIIVVAGAAGLVVLLLLMRNKPETAAPAQEEVLETPAQVVQGDLDERIDRGIELVKGEAPMQGIFLLREVLDEDPNNLRAHYHLGLFSMQSKQWDKAVGRFETVAQIDSTYKNTLFHLGESHIALGQKESAQSSIEAFIRLSTDENKKSQAREYLEKNIKN